MVLSCFRIPGDGVLQEVWGSLLVQRRLEDEAKALSGPPLMFGPWSCFSREPGFCFKIISYM